MAQVNAGRVRFVSRGEYNSSTQYYLFDLVNYEGSSYVAIGNTLGNIPTNTTYWQLVAEKGNTGSVGPEGPQGVGIASITKTATVGLVDTYTITYTNGTTSTFQVTNGEDGDVTPTEFNALKADVEDLRDNQIIYPSLDQPALEGTNIHVEDAAKARLYEFEMTKESTQETTTGKNLIPTDVNDWEQGTILGSNGTNSDSTTRIRTINYYPITSGDKYLSIIGTDYCWLNLIYYDSEKNFITTQASILSISGSKNAQITVPNNTAYFRATIRKTNDGTITASEITTVKPMIETGTAGTTWEEFTGGQPSPSPEFPQEVKTVKGYEKDGNNYVDVVVKANNILDTQTFIKYYIKDDGALQSDSKNALFNFVDVKPNENYEISFQGEITGFRYAYYDINQTFVSRSGLNTTSQIITIPNNIKYVRMYVNVDNDTITQEKVDLINLKFRNLQTYPVPLNGNEIVGIGDYKDELIVDKSGNVFINKKTGKVVLNGSENWQDASVTNYSRFRTSLSDAISESGRIIILSNYFRYLSSGNAIGGAFTSAGRLYLYPNENITILQDFTTWLSTHNTEVYYVLETPELIDLQTTVDIKLFKGINNIINSEDANMKIRYVESIDSLVARVVALEEANS